MQEIPVEDHRSATAAATPKEECKREKQADEGDRKERSQSKRHQLDARELHLASGMCGVNAHQKAANEPRYQKRVDRVANRQKR